MKLIFIGLPGCGKTTQAKKLSEHLGISYISMRQLVVQESGLIKSQSWQPLSDDLAVEICQKAIACKTEFILDGFPRNKEQYQGLKLPEATVVWLDISFQESQKRMLRRGDNKQAIAYRTLLERQRFPLLIEAIKSDRCECHPYNGTLSEQGLFEKLIERFNDGIAF